ncbi:MAG TPA: hypothetical protein VGL86_32805 [Polyangia bacterium]|jgi:hypothetical protein
MMRHALVALGPRTMAMGVLVGGAALALGALFLPHAVAAPTVAPSAMYRLVLHAPVEGGAFYVSAWAEGEVFVKSHDAKNLTFVRRGEEHDGCTWQGTERLTRLNDGAYAYDYAETILSCRPDARPFRKTPRSGIVTVEQWDGPATATALVAVQAPGNLWNPTAMNDIATDDDDCGCADDDDDSEVALADAQRELADAQKEIDQAMHQADQELKAALAHVDSDDDD